MGSSGPKVFDSDLAADVRAEYRDLIGDGVNGAAATDRLLASYGGGMDDPDEAPDFWIGLAVAQCEVGRLEARVHDRALAYIDEGGDISRFHGDQEARRLVLEEVRQRLIGPQREPVQIRRSPKSICPYQVGDVLQVTLNDGHRILLCVQGVHRDLGGEAAEVAVLDWQDSALIPSMRRLARHRLAASPWKNPKEEARGLGFILIAATKKDRDRLESSVRTVATLAPRSTTITREAVRYVIKWTDLERWFDRGRVRSSPVVGQEIPDV